jgi:hypothetical protein
VNWPRPSSRCTPSRKRAPPTPPTRTVTFTPHDSTPGDGQDAEPSRAIKPRGIGPVDGVTDTPWRQRRQSRKETVTRWYGIRSNRLQSAASQCVITAVSFRLAGRIRCRRPRFDHLFESRWPHIKTVVTFTINETR